jgi:hypothetical protein
VRWMRNLVTCVERSGLKPRLDVLVSDERYRSDRMFWVSYFRSTATVSKEKFDVLILEHKLIYICVCIIAEMRSRFKDFTHQRHEKAVSA